MISNIALKRSIKMLLLLSIGLGGIYPVLAPGLALEIGVLWKGACVGLLALAAGLQARTGAAWLLSGLLIAGTLGDVFLAIPGAFMRGVLAFGIGHILAILLYLSHSRWPIKPALAGLAVIVLLSGLAVDILGLGDPAIAAYALMLIAMTISAWTSHYPRPVAIGATLFLISDALIGVQMTASAPHPAGLNLAIWWLYYFGQLLIYLFVTKTTQAVTVRQE